LRETLRSQAVRDPLTGLFNRRYMEESLERELHRASRNRYPIGVIMIDVDYFKRFNDTHGHEAGDTMLRAVGEFLQSSIRAEDIACRYGGEEFTLIMPQASLEVTTDRAEHVRNTIKNLQVFYLNHPLGPVSISAGVTVIPRHGMSVQSALRQADRALYRAKNAGRDQVMIARIDDDDDDDDDNGDER
jgi:diguanylate cyclase (GGDEF)-like protein